MRNDVTRSLSEILQLITDEPGITASEISTRLNLDMNTVYNRITKLRSGLKIKTLTKEGVSCYYTMGAEVVEMPDVPQIPISIGGLKTTLRILSPEQFETLTNKPPKTKYAELLAQLERLNVGEVVVVETDQLDTESVRTRIRTWYRASGKLFYTRSHGTYLTIERIK